ncbi:hypothetical protein [Candidatus Cyanaurora vandensis]|uniref:hypothetical protein n=1 Tax=Candidatus Cyanaurora vandensis TaxID=2714958 RepID=UPI00257AE0DD|nr:hypothetical protein [Candidatus Cyanaurora vandensis]
MIDLDRFMRETPDRRKPPVPPLENTAAKDTDRSYPRNERPPADQMTSQAVLPTPWQVEVLDTPYTRCSLPNLIGKTFTVLDVQDFATGKRYRVALGNGNPLWLPREVVKVTLSPRYREMAQQHEGRTNWNAW